MKTQEESAQYGNGHSPFFQMNLAILFSAEILDIGSLLENNWKKNGLENNALNFLDKYCRIKVIKT